MKARSGKILMIAMLVCASTIPLSPLSLFHSLRAQYRVEHLEKPYNTPGSETAAIKVGDTILVYSSMQPQTSRMKNKQFSFAGSQTNIWQARIARDGKIARPRFSRWGLNTKKYHTGNLCIDPQTSDLYFTRCAVDDPDLRCEIWWARKQKRGWARPERLHGSVNLREYTSTQPTIGRLKDSTIILYFASNRPGGMGGMDLWYTLVKEGVAGEAVNLGPQVNSVDDEVTPFYDQKNNVLYFSSNRTGGKGGHDIFCASGYRNTWQRAETVCGCLNSEQNDIYFTITDYDATGLIPVAGYLSSNRSDSYFLSDSLCCNDIYRWSADSLPWAKENLAFDTITPHIDTLPLFTVPLSSFHFPLFLYFHNDDPDPRSRDSVTTAIYTDCQQHYASLRDEYLSHQPSTDDSVMITAFFDSCVIGNYEIVEALLDHIEEQLDYGHHVELTISGYASPLFTDEYNRALSSRRIASFINMIRAWRNGLFADAIDDGRLIVVQKAYGIDRVSHNSAQNLNFTDPVYSLPAALARRIEILSCEVK